jgi:peroxiredoxin
MLRHNYVTNRKIGKYLQQLTLRAFWPGIEALFREVLERNPDHGARGHACFGLAEILSRRAKLPKLMNDPVMAQRMKVVYGKEQLAEILNQDPEASLREATALYERVVSEFADVKYWLDFPDDKMTLGVQAEKRLAEWRDLAIGRPAPEIEGQDVDGKTFKLSDYRGSVVALVFWASWCAPCMQQLPHERELARRMEGKPFTLLGVNCDYKVSTARAVLAKEKIAWPNWYDGDARQGKIANRYHIQSLPAIFVIDGKGLIREKDVRGESLDKAIEALLKEKSSAEPVGGKGAPRPAFPTNGFCGGG